MRFLALALKKVIPELALPAFSKSAAQSVNKWVSNFLLRRGGAG